MVTSALDGVVAKGQTVGEIEYIADRLFINSLVRYVKNSPPSVRRSQTRRRVRLTTQASIPAYLDA
jgi:hypothetical protein